MSKRPKTKTLKNKLDKSFSLMVRTRDWEMPCVSCGKMVVDIDRWQAGHFVKREILATRWHPWNVNGECSGCNGFDTRHLIGYYPELQRRHGEHIPQALLRLSRMHWHPQHEQLERLILACENPADYESEWFAVQREFAPEFELRSGDLEGANQ